MQHDTDDVEQTNTPDAPTRLADPVPRNPDSHLPGWHITSGNLNRSPVAEHLPSRQRDADATCDPHEFDRSGNRLSFVRTILALIRWQASDVGNESVPAEDVRQVCEQVGMSPVPADALEALLKLRTIAPTLLQAIRATSVNGSAADDQWRAAVERDDRLAARLWLAALTTHQTV